MRPTALWVLACQVAVTFAAGAGCSKSATSGGSGGGSVGNGGSGGASGAATGGAGIGTGGAAYGSGGNAAGAAGAGAGAGGGAGGGASGGNSGTAGSASGGRGGGGGGSPSSGPWTITSPGGVVRGTVSLADKGGTADYPAKTRLYYRVEVGGPTSYAEALPDSPLGLTRTDQDFVDGLIFDSAGDQTVIDETYTMLTGKRSQPRNHANERLLNFHAGSGSRVQVVIRAYDDGFAFRYRFPEVDATPRTVSSEATGFRLPAGTHASMLPYDAAGMYTPGYEAFWQSDVAVGTAVAAPAIGWCLPVLFQTPSNQWVLLAESDVDGAYFGAHLGPTAASLVYRIALPAAAEANAIGVVAPTSTLPWQTPWRVVIAGTSLRPIVESTLITDLARPSTVTDTSWIKPGRVSWSWWSDDASPTDYNRLVPFVDLSASMGWEYSLVDANWTLMTNGTWQALATYAAAKNVGLFLWYSSGGPNNSVLQYAPRDRINDATVRQAEFQTISRAGIKGIKIDFFLSDKPWMMQYYLDILKDAAAAHLLVNFHGATMPRGWQRTYPNLMTMEAVKGAEEYKYTAGYPAGQPARNTIFPFTRNVVGSMDFTPVSFTDALYPHVTTNAHELALSVVFESGLQHFADRVSGYQTLPAAPRTFLQQVPTAWDDTRLLDGVPGQSVVLARRKGAVWYIGGISGDPAARTVSLGLAFLGAGAFNMTVISDGTTDRTFGSGSVTQSPTVASTDMLTVNLRAHGGFVARLAPAP